MLSWFHGVLAVDFVGSRDIVYFVPSLGNFVSKTVVVCSLFMINEFLAFVLSVRSYIRFAVSAPLNSFHLQRAVLQFCWQCSTA